MSRTSMRVSAPSTKTVRRIVMQNLLEWDTPRSLSIYLILKHGSDSDFLSLTSIDPRDFLSASSYAEFSLPTDLIRKWPGLDMGIDRRQTAVQRFHQAEDMCRATNRRLNLGMDPTGRLGELIHSVRKIISYVLPPVTVELLDGFVEEGGWGNGVTSSVKGKDLRLSTKLGSNQQSTSALHHIAARLMAEVNGMSGQLTVQDYNVVSFVPKDAKTDRAIAVEPSLNSYLQRGAGKVIRAALRRRLGVDLKHGQEYNAHLAKLGSIDGSFATVDLSMASDTVSRKLIRYLLPDEWVTLLGLLRTSHYRLNNETPVQYEKWSSMGNGYTFELETLIFAACARSVARGGKYAVYGDDIIVPTHGVEDLANLLTFLGFSFNEEKSFTDGPFRESCGSDYFHGVNVRGFYIKNENPALPYIWYNFLAADRLLKPCPMTMDLLRRSVGPTASFAPYRTDSAFWVSPYEFPEVVRPGIKRGVKGYYGSKVTFRAKGLALNQIEDGLLATAVHCRLVMADDPIERQAVVEYYSEVGKWERRTFFYALMGPEGSWPRS